jgi:hypothetical protein
MSAFENHFTIKELAGMWKVSRVTAWRIVKRYEHLLPNINKKRRSRFGPIKRHREHLRIPRSVAERIYRDLIGGGEHAA